LLYCYHYDPHTGKYGLLINRIIIAAGLLTVALMTISIFILARSEHYALPTRRA
jgi:protein SCO1